MDFLLHQNALGNNELVTVLVASGSRSLNTALTQTSDLLQKIMTFSQVNYWHVNHTGDINDQQTAHQVFDHAVPDAGYSDGIPGLSFESSEREALKPILPLALRRFFQIKQLLYSCYGPCYACASADNRSQ